MRKYFKILYACLFVLLMSSCEEYLDKSPYSDVTDADVFVNFEDFQAFIEANDHGRMIDYNINGQNSCGEFSDQVISASNGGIALWAGQQGDYWALLNPTSGASGPLMTWNSGSYSSIFNGEFGLWPNTWTSLRANNMALEKLPMLKGTTRQHELIEGQARFFRAFYISELSKWMGGLPYIKRTLKPDEQFNEKRLTSMGTIDSAAVDFDKAALLLPNNWDELSKTDHPYQAYDPNTGLSSNTGRVTKGAVYAMKALAMLWAGSPLSNSASKGHKRPDGQTVSGTYDFDPYYMEQAAKAAYEVIKLAENNNVYQLVGFDEYQSFTAQRGSLSPWVSPTGRKEVIWAIVRQKDVGNNDMVKSFGSADIGGAGRQIMPTQNQVDCFEMTNGLPITDANSGYNAQNPYVNRDPRLNANIILPNEIVFGNRINNSWRTGSARAKMASSYLVRKYLVKANATAGATVRAITPYARLAEMYLVYAEAVNEVYGPITKPTWGAYTAVEALNKVRGRALSYTSTNPNYLKPMMPNVDAKFTVSKEVFRARIWNERRVELAYEAKGWFDIRRWHVATNQEYKDLYSLECDLVGGKLVNFAKILQTTKVFDEKHYWVPIPKAQAQLSEGFSQAPGW